MTSVSQLIEQCSGMLHSYTGTVEQATYLTQSIGAADVTFTVAHPTRVLQGVIEIDDELMQVSDQSSTDVTLFPFGRGVSSTPATAHTLGSKVTTDPLVPRRRLFEELVATIRQCADLYRVKTGVFSSSPVVNTYPLPTDCRRVLKVQWDTIGPSQEWPANRTWTVDPNADVATFPTGKSITIDGYIGVPGQGIQVTYVADLGIPTGVTDSLEDLGIPPELHDVFRYGVAWRAIQMMAPGKLNARAVEDPSTNGVSPSSIKDVAQQMYAMFTVRRQEEKKRLDLQYPPRPHRVR